MKKYLLILFSLALIACSKDDDSDNISFLEKYDGLGFVSTDDYYDDDYSYYVFFSNSNNFITFVDDEDGYDTYCYSLREGTMSDFDDDIDVSIVTNNSSRLVINIDYVDDGQYYTDIIEYSVSSDGNTLTEMYDDDPSDVDTYRRTTTTLSSLCN